MNVTQQKTVVGSRTRMRWNQFKKSASNFASVYRRSKSGLLGLAILFFFSGIIVEEVLCFVLRNRSKIRKGHPKNRSVPIVCNMITSDIPEPSLLFLAIDGIKQDFEIQNECTQRVFPKVMHARAFVNCAYSVRYFEI